MKSFLKEFLKGVRDIFRENIFTKNTLKQLLFTLGKVILILAVLFIASKLISTQVVSVFINVVVVILAIYMVILVIQMLLFSLKSRENFVIFLVILAFLAYPLYELFKLLPDIIKLFSM